MEKDIPEFVLDQLGQEVRVGDTIAYSVLLGRSASISIGTVLDICWSKAPSYGVGEQELKVKVQGFEPWSEWHEKYGKERGLKKPGFLHANFRRFVKLENKEK